MPIVFKSTFTRSDPPTVIGLYDTVAAATGSTEQYVTSVTGTPSYSINTSGFGGVVVAEPAALASRGGLDIYATIVPVDIPSEATVGIFEAWRIVNDVRETQNFTDFPSVQAWLTGAFPGGFAFVKRV